MSPSPSSTTSKPSIKTRLLILSDTHAALPFPASSSSSASTSTSTSISTSASTCPHPFRAPLPASDVLLHCGDLSLTGEPHEYARALSLISSAPAPLKLVIPGNHDLTLDADYWERTKREGRRRYCSEATARKEEAVREAEAFWTGEEARWAGVVYLGKQERRTFELANGAKLGVFVSGWTPEFCGWGFAYPRHVDVWGAKGRGVDGHGHGVERGDVGEKLVGRGRSKNEGEGEGQGEGKGEGEDVDVVMTHGPPMGYRDEVHRRAVGCEWLAHAIRRARPQVHCFGHIHEGWGAEMVRWGEQVEAFELRPAYVRLEDARRNDVVESVGLNVAAGNSKQEIWERRAAYVDLTGDGEMQHEPGKTTLMVNAAIMDVNYKPSNAPWIVDLLLPPSSGKK